MAQDESKIKEEVKNNSHAVAVVQMTSTTDVDHNFTTISNLMQKISKYPVEMVLCLNRN